MGHEVDKNPLIQKERQDSEYGFAESDIGLLKTLRILKFENGQLQVNKKLAPSRNDILEFLHWTTGSRKAPLPPIARRILCLKRAIIMNSVRSVQTGNLQRTGENKQLEEIDALLRSDGVVNLDGKTCATENSSFVGGVPTVTTEPSTTTGTGCSTVVNCDSSAVTSLLEGIKASIDELKGKAPSGADASTAKLEKLKEGIDALNTRVNDTASNDDKHAKIMGMLEQIKALLATATTNAATDPTQFEDIAENAINQANKNIDKAHATINEQLRIIDEKVTTIGSDSKNTKTGVNTIKEDLEFLKDAVGKIKCCENKDKYITKLEKLLNDAGIELPEREEEDEEEKEEGEEEATNNKPSNEEPNNPESQGEATNNENAPQRERLVVDNNGTNALPEPHFRNSENNYDSDTSLPLQQRGKKPSRKSGEKGADDGTEEAPQRERLVVDNNGTNALPEPHFRNSENNYDSDTSLPLQQRGKKPSRKSGEKGADDGAEEAPQRERLVVDNNDTNALPEPHFRNSENNYDSDTSLPLQQRGKKPSRKSGEKGEGDGEEEAPQRERLVIDNDDADALPEPRFHNSNNNYNSNTSLPPQQRGKKPSAKGKKPAIAITGEAEDLSGDEADVSNNNNGRARYTFPPNNEERVSVPPTYVRTNEKKDDTPNETVPIDEDIPLAPKSNLYKGLMESIKLEGYGKIKNKDDKVKQLEKLINAHNKKNKTFAEVKELVDAFLNDFGEKGTLKTRLKYHNELLTEDTWFQYVEKLIDGVKTISKPPKTRKRGRKMSNHYTRKGRR